MPLPGVELARPQYADVVGEVAEYLLERAGNAVAAGVREGPIVVDPGHDLNKNTIHSLELTRRLGELDDARHPAARVGVQQGLPPGDVEPSGGRA